MRTRPMTLWCRMYFTSPSAFCSSSVPRPHLPGGRHHPHPPPQTPPLPPTPRLPSRRLVGDDEPDGRFRGITARARVSQTDRTTASGGEG